MTRWSKHQPQGDDAVRVDVELEHEDCLHYLDCLDLAVKDDQPRCCEGATTCYVAMCRDLRIAEVGAERLYSSAGAFTGSEVNENGLAGRAAKVIRFDDSLVGRKFGTFTVVQKLPHCTGDTNTHWLLTCECGVQSVRSAPAISSWLHRGMEPTCRACTKRKRKARAAKRAHKAAA